MNEKVNETLSVSGSLLVKIFAKEKKEYEDFVRINEEVTQYALKERRSGQWFRMVKEINVLDKIQPVEYIIQVARTTLR